MGSPPATHGCANPGNAVWMGRYYSRYFRGTIDEVRISRQVHTGDWIATCHANQAAPAARLESPVKPVPQAFMVKGILVDQQRCKIVLKYATGRSRAT